MPDIREAEANYSATDVTLVTTAETVIISAPALVLPADASRIVILAWVQLTTGAASTTVTPRIRRGATTSDALVGEANAETVKAAAGSTEPFFIMVAEDVNLRDRLIYSLTLQQAAATGNGAAVQASILVLAF
jgi:hypothetical protein